MLCKYWLKLNSLFNELEGFRKSPIVLFVLLNLFFRSSSNVDITSKITPRCFWDLIWETLLLKSKGGYVAFFNFLLNLTSWVCLLRSRLKFIFHWNAQTLIFFRVTVLLSSRYVYIMYYLKSRSIISK